MKIFFEFFVVAVIVTLATAPGAKAHEVGHHHDEPGHETVHAGDATNVRDSLRLFRETGDDRHLDAAWGLASQALDNAPDTPELLIDAAMVAQARHHFDSALAMTDRAIELRQNDDQAWLLRASIKLVQGDAVAARNACRQLRFSHILLVTTCHARVALAEGNAAASKDRFDALLAATGSSGLPGDWLAWSLSVSGDLAAATGNADEAISRYLESLSLVENTQVRSALADVYIARGMLEEARALLDDASPALPIVIRRMIVATRMGVASDYRKDIEAADRRFRHWIDTADWLHAREMARFYLDVLPQPALARRLARINIELQKEPEDIRLAARTG